MMRELTKEEHKKNIEELIKFCKENHCLMYSYMLTIKRIRKEPEDKILEEKLKKQAKDYKKKEELTKKFKKN